MPYRAKVEHKTENHRTRGGGTQKHSCGGNDCFAPGAFGYFEVTHDITKYCKAKIFSKIGKRTPLGVRFSTVGE